MQFRLTPSVKGLSIALLAFFLSQHLGDRFFGTHFTQVFGLSAHAFFEEGKIWQIFTYAFLHGDVLHLFFNLMLLIFIGAELESLWGAFRFLRFYFFTTVGAGLIYLLIVLFFGQASWNVLMMGASGGIYGLLLAFGILFSERLMLFMMIFPMKAKVFVVVLGALEFFTLLFSGQGAALSSAAHLGGMVAGFGYLMGEARYRIWIRERSAGISAKESAERRSRIKKGHLKLVDDHSGSPANAPGRSKNVTPLERKAGSGQKGFPRSPEDSEDDSESGPKTWH